MAKLKVLNLYAGIGGNRLHWDKVAVPAVFADMSLWQIILFLKHHGNMKFVVENVIPYYSPLIKETIQIDRHLYWSNFNISKIEVEKDTIIEKTVMSDLKGFDITKYTEIKNKQQVIRNQVNNDIGEHILRCALNKVEHKQGGLF